ncbi:signal recognition particle subunit SRP68-like [Corticium candelabrum]|uniref:signal recognition particle subunit SRP68-like n=1 Tax=Corticium candelabrum TaxID=121492 RepID=UPI002E35FA86|nr:signal recognition particle subunit SRP68-like [Corticium candelabrum]
MAEEAEKPNDEQKDKAEIKQSDKVLYSLEILSSIKESQSQHGLRHGDYQRYRQYCARRLRRIRKSLRFVHASKHRFHQRKLTVDVITDSKFLLLPLVNAERAWAYAMQLRHLANTEPRKRFHLIKRLKKAALHAAALAELCQHDICDVRTKLEAQAYSAWMTGNLKFELQEWQEALDVFSEAKTIYEKLASALPDEVKTLYLQRADEITPNVRYCAYNLGDGSTDIEDLVKLRVHAGDQDLLVGKLDEVLAQSREQQAEMMKEITWRGQTIPVKNEKVRVFILQSQESSREIERAESFEQKMELFDSLLMACKDVQQIIKDELKTDGDKAKRSHKSEAQVANMEFLLSYISFIRLSKTIDRNQLMAESFKTELDTEDTKKELEKGRRKATKPDDLIRLYDILLQNVSDLLEIQGLADDVELSQQLGTQSLAFRAHRCFYIAEMYRIAKKWGEATGLYDRCVTRATGALDQYKLLSEPNVKEVTSLQDLLVKARGRKCTTHASSILEMQEIEQKMEGAKLEEAKPLLSRLNTYSEDPNPLLVSFPPDFEPVPCKPLFFDLAVNHIQFPSLKDHVEKKKAGGITGFVNRLIWGSSK